MEIQWEAAWLTSGKVFTAVSDSVDARRELNSPEKNVTYLYAILYVQIRSKPQFKKKFWRHGQISSRPAPSELETAAKANNSRVPMAAPSYTHRFQCLQLYKCVFLYIYIYIGEIWNVREREREAKRAVCVREEK